MARPTDLEVTAIVKKIAVLTDSKKRHTTDYGEATQETPGSSGGRGKGGTMSKRLYCGFCWKK